MSGLLGYMVSVMTTGRRHHSMKAATEDELTSGCGCVPVTLYLWALKSEFYIIFMCHEIFFFFFNHLKHTKIILSLQAVQNQVVGLYRPCRRSLPTPALREQK